MVVFYYQSLMKPQPVCQLPPPGEGARLPTIFRRGFVGSCQGLLSRQMLGGGPTPPLGGGDDRLIFFKVTDWFLAGDPPPSGGGGIFKSVFPPSGFHCFFLFFSFTLVFCPYHIPYSARAKTTKWEQLERRNPHFT